MQTFKDKEWKYLDRLDRVYDCSNAIRDLGWSPKYTYQAAVERLEYGQEWRSPLHLQVGKKGLS